MTRIVFLDTAYAIALSSEGDRLHDEAIRFAEIVTRTGVQLVTTRAVLLEIGNALSKQRYRSAACALLDSLEHDPRVEIVSLPDELYARALGLYRRMNDKEWGLTDCISFIVMAEHGISEALTSDKHFKQAGFETLLT